MPDVLRVRHAGREDDRTGRQVELRADPRDLAGMRLEVSLGPFSIAGAGTAGPVYGIGTALDVGVGVERPAVDHLEGDEVGVNRVCVARRVHEQPVLDRSGGWPRRHLGQAVRTEIRGVAALEVQNERVLLLLVLELVKRLLAGERRSGSGRCVRATWPRSPSRSTSSPSTTTRAASCAPTPRVGLPLNVRPETGQLTDMGWEVYPAGLGEVLLRLHRDYGVSSLYVTENGAAFADVRTHDGRVHDLERVAYLRDYIGSVADAIAAGAPIRGHFVWSLLDNFEWAFGYPKRFGLVHVDYPTLQRIPKDSFYWYRDLIAELRQESHRTPSAAYVVKGAGNPQAVPREA